MALGVVLVLGTVAEVAGVLTGFPFGRYAYTTRWWPVVSLPDGHWFPLQVPFAWFLVVGASLLAVSRLGQGRLGKGSVLLTGALAATIDLIMEPVMTGPLGYWRWLDAGPLPGGAPIANFLGWFATAAVAALALNAFGAAQAWRAWEPTAVLVGHVALVLGIGAIHAF